MTTHELARHLLKKADIKVSVQSIDEYKAVEVVKYAVASSDNDGQQNTYVLRGESYKREVMRTMQTSNAKANTLDRSRLISPSSGKAFEEYTENFKSMLVKRYNWSVKNANEYKSSALKDCFEEGLSPQMSYYKIFEISEEQQEPRGDGKRGSD